MLPRPCLALIVALACVPLAWAGEEKESSSQRPGLFFAWLSPDDGPVWAHFENPAHLQQLVRHCNAGTPVFALQSGTRFQCKAELPPKSAGQEEPYAAALTVQGARPQTDNPQYRLFALTPPRTPQWLVARPDAEQRAHCSRSCSRTTAGLARCAASSNGVLHARFSSPRAHAPPWWCLAGWCATRTLFTEPSGTMFLCVVVVAVAAMPTWVRCPASPTATWTSTATTCRALWCRRGVTAGAYRCGA